LFLVAFNWLHGLLKGRPAPANPWGGNSLEWHTPSPPPHDNFSTALPVVDDPYRMSNWVRDPHGEGYIRNPNSEAATAGH